MRESHEYKRTILKSYTMAFIFQRGVKGILKDYREDQSPVHHRFELA
jgi:hypothetical protein